MKTKTNSAEITRNVKHIGARFWLKLKGEKTLIDTGKLQPETRIITSALCNAVTPVIRI